ncbi:MAG: porin [Desulfatiglandales bacterium]
MRKIMVFFLVWGVLLGVLITTAEASDKLVTVYGSVRMDTWWVDRSKEKAGGDFDDSDLLWDQDMGSSRFGAKFKTGDIKAQVEIRPRDRDKGNGTQNETLRQWWGAWNFGKGELLIGQAYVPCYAKISNVSLEGGTIATQYGDFVSTSRTPMMQLSFPFSVGTLKMAALKPSDKGADTVVKGTRDTDITLPKFEASFDFKFGPASMMVFGGYNTTDEVDTSTDREYSIDSHVIGLNARVNLGPAYLKGIIYTAQNQKNYGTEKDWVWNAYYDAASDSITDIDAMGWFLVAGCKVSDMLSVEAGYGQRKLKRERPGFDKDEDKNAMFYINMPITVAKGFTITPEIEYYDEKDQKIAGVSKDQGNTTYYGVYWRIDF